jgi:O-antigen/teichoic acid export membrane protein
MISLLATTFLVIFIAPYFSKIEGALVLIPLIALLSIFDNLRDFIIAYLRGLEKMEWEAFIMIAMNTIMVITGFIVLKISPTSKTFLLSYVISTAFSVFLAVFIIRNQIIKAFNNFDKKIALQTIIGCWPIAISSLIGAFMLNTDMIMLGWWRTAEEIGFYSAGQRIVLILYTLPMFLASGIFPAISRFIKQKNREKEKFLNEKSFTLIFLISTPLVIGGVILAKPIIEFLYGKEYLAGTMSLQILLFTLLLIFPGILISNLILAHNQQKKVIWYWTAGAVSNIAFNALLIPYYGIVGSSIATVAAQLINYGLTWRYIKKISDFKTFRYLKKIFLAAVLMGILSFILNKTGLNVIINIIISAAFYFGALYILKEKILEEIKFLLMAVRK